MAQSAGKNGKRVRNGGSHHGLSPVEVALVEFFVSLADMAGMPKSVGEIYGLLKEKIGPRLAEGAKKLAQLEEIIAKETPNLRKVHENRIGRIRSWQKAGQRIIPFALKFLKG